MKLDPIKYGMAFYVGLNFFGQKHSLENSPGKDASPGGYGFACDDDYAGGFAVATFLFYGIFDQGCLIRSDVVGALVGGGFGADLHVAWIAAG
jgi:hypothetical protein